MISATTVAIGFSALLTVPISELRSIGIAGLLVTVLSVMLCTFILPWVLGFARASHQCREGAASRTRLGKPRRHRAQPERAVGRWGSIVTAPAVDSSACRRSPAAATCIPGAENLARAS